MSKFEVGDLVKGLPESNIYGLTKAVVKKVDEKYIEVKILEHKLGHTGIYTVEAKCFEKIGRIEPFDREKFLDLLKESNAKAIEYLIDADLSNANLSGANLRYADLRGADLSGSQGLLDAINYMEANFERTDEGYIVYKIFNENCSAPEAWKIEPGEIIEETVNCDRTIEYGCGINVAPLELVKKYGCNQPYKLLIRWEWLPGVVVPYNTDGKIRCSKAQILEAVE